MSALKTLYRPVGVRELELILANGSRFFPPRLPWQPIFYPVLNFDYAEQIARQWNTNDKNSGYAGFVTAFSLDTEYLNQFPERQVGHSTHRELWVPAEQLKEFNRSIAGPIRIKAAFYGDKYQGPQYPVDACK